MAKKLAELEVSNRRAWRRWLEKHHVSSAGIWLVRYKGARTAASMSYEELVREALCFGWIDSLVRRIDDERYAIKVTPRKPTSKWSDLNRKRWAELRVAGLLSPSGLAAAPTENKYASLPKVPALPAYISKAFKANASAWLFFQQLAPTYRRHFIGWIHTAKRPETRQKRIQEAVRLLAEGKKLGLR